MEGLVGVEGLELGPGGRGGGAPGILLDIPLLPLRVDRFESLAIATKIQIANAQAAKNAATLQRRFSCTLCSWCGPPGFRAARVPPACAGDPPVCTPDPRPTAASTRLAISSSADTSLSRISVIGSISANTSRKVLVSLCATSSSPCLLNSSTARLRTLRMISSLGEWLMPLLAKLIWVGCAMTSHATIARSSCATMPATSPPTRRTWKTSFPISCLFAAIFSWTFRS